MADAPDPPSNGVDITFFVACYNEEENIISALKTVIRACQQVGRTYDIVIIDDNSNDKTVAVIEEFMAQNPNERIKLLVNPTNLGLGVNFGEAAFHGRGRYYRLICGDDEESQESIVAALSRLGEADIILTYHRDNSARTFSRRVISHVFTTIVNILSGQKIRYYNGLPITVRETAMRWHSHCHGFGFQADLIVRLLSMGATYVEVPVVAKNRVAGTSKALTVRNLGSVVHTLFQIMVRRIATLLYPKYSPRLSISPVIKQTPGFDR